MGGVVGKEVSGCQIESVLGRGGMGVMYKAEQLALGRPVALKRIDPLFGKDPSFLRRFRAEARALARIDSPHIVQVYDLRETEIGHVIVMEYVDGGTVKDRLRGGPMEESEALAVIDQTLRALGQAHAAGVIHSDIKPHDTLLGAGGRVKVTDFGLVKVSALGGGQGRRWRRWWGGPWRSGRPRATPRPPACEQPCKMPRTKHTIYERNLNKDG